MYLIKKEIFVLFNDDEEPMWQQFSDNFEDGMPELDESMIAPPEHLQPIRGFGLVWRENSEVRDRLGWATESEVGYDGVIQSSEDNIYLRVQNGGILVIKEGDWEILPFIETPFSVSSLASHQERPFS